MVSTGEHSGLVDGLDGSTWVHVPVPLGESEMQLPERTTSRQIAVQKLVASLQQPLTNKTSSVAAGYAIYGPI